MAISKSVAAKNAACNAIVDMLNDGTSNPSGSLNLYTSDSTLIASLPLSIPAFMDSTDGTAVASAITDSTAFIDATAYSFSFVDRDETAVWWGTVSDIGGSGDMEINSVIIPADTTISIYSATYVVP